jgi:hypothetical protein
MLGANEREEWMMSYRAHIRFAAFASVPSPLMAIAMNTPAF